MRSGIQRRAIGILLGVLVLAVPRPSAADPVRLSYSVVINERCQAGSCQPFQAAFDLTLTFDSTALLSGDNFVRYGDPTFSPVPLDRPAISPAADDSLNTHTQEQWLQSQTTGFSHTFFAQREHATAGNLEEWHVGIFVTRRVMTPPDLSPDALAARLLGLGPARFTYTYIGLDPVTGDVTPNSLRYSGSAQLTNAAPVPEPTSLLLMGSGAAGLIAWRRRRREKQP